MGKINLISHYDISKPQFKNMRTAGEIYFHRPCIGYVKKGYAKFLYEGKTFFAYEGDLIYIAYETRYQSIWYGSPDIEWYSIDFEFNSKFTNYDYRFQILKDYPSELFDKMYLTYEKSPMQSVSYFYMLLDDIYKKLEKLTSNKTYPAIQKAIEWIENNYNKEILVSELANLCSVSESNFFRLFKKATGVTPITYKQNIMMQNAIDLLSNTSLSVEEISDKVGFSSSNYFRKVFAKLVGGTPKGLRKKA